MANLDVSWLLLDPDFSSVVTLIVRQLTVDGNGETQMSETITPNVVMCIQGADRETIDRMPEGAKLSDIITVYYAGPLHAESPGGYADVIVWKGKRYQVKDVINDYTHFAGSWSKAACELEAVSA